MDEENGNIVVLPAALESLERASVDIQITTAKKYPRSVEKYRKKVLEIATTDPEVAGDCFYKLKRKNRDGTVKIIEGPSVRLTEIMAQAWGNLRIAGRIIEEGDKDIVAQGVCHDLESNVLISTEVRKRITTKGGRRFSDDMIIMTMNAGVATAKRNAVIQTIPKALIKDIFSSIKKTAVGNAQTMVERRENCVVAFEKMGISREQVEAYLGKRISEMDFDDYESMQGLFTALRDGQTTPEEAFPENVEAPPELGPYKMSPEMAKALTAQIGEPNVTKYRGDFIAFVESIRKGHPEPKPVWEEIEKEIIASTEQAKDFIKAFKIFYTAKNAPKEDPGTKAPEEKESGSQEPSEAQGGNAEEKGKDDKEPEYIPPGETEKPEEPKENKEEEPSKELPGWLSKPDSEIIDDLKHMKAPGLITWELNAREFIPQLKPVVRGYFEQKVKKVFGHDYVPGEDLKKKGSEEPKKDLFE